jgi:hypothetical protein
LPDFIANALLAMFALRATVLVVCARQGATARLHAFVAGQLGAIGRVDPRAVSLEEEQQRHEQDNQHPASSGGDALGAQFGHPRYGCRRWPAQLSPDKTHNVASMASVGTAVSTATSRAVSPKMGAECNAYYRISADPDKAPKESYTSLQLATFSIGATRLASVQLTHDLLALFDAEGKKKRLPINEAFRTMSLGAYELRGDVLLAAAHESAHQQYRQP